MVGIVIFVPGAQQEMNILMMVLGMLATKVNTLVDYFFGTSLPKMKRKKKDKEDEATN